MIDWVLLDGSGVLFDMDHPMRLARLVSRCDPRPDPADLDDAVWGSGLDDRFDEGEFGEDEILGYFRERWGYSGTLDDLRADWSSGFVPNESLLQLLRSAARRLRFAVLSDNGPLLLAALPKLFPAIDQLVDPVVFSCDIKVRKPALAAFDAALTAMGASAERVLFADDLAENCRAAASLGMHACHFTETADLARHIEFNTARQA